MYLTSSFLFFFPVSAVYVSSAAVGVESGRQRHAPLYGRFVVEEELPATHRDVMHHVSYDNNKKKRFIKSLRVLREVLRKHNPGTFFRS